MDTKITFITDKSVADPENIVLIRAKAIINGAEKDIQHGRFSNAEFMAIVSQGLPLLPKAKQEELLAQLQKILNPTGNQHGIDA